MDDETASHHFRMNLHKLAEKAKCLKDISRAEVKRFDNLWNDGQNKIIGPDSKIKYTRELSYKLDDAAYFMGSFGEHHSYQIRESCCMIVVEALEDGLEEDSALILKNALKQLENVSNTIDDLTKINPGTEDDPRPTFISMLLPEEVTSRLKAFLKGYMDCFAWSYKEIPGLDLTW
jgi:hypothetical protein